MWLKRNHTSHTGTVSSEWANLPDPMRPSSLTKRCADEPQEPSSESVSPPPSGLLRRLFRLVVYSRYAHSEDVHRGSVGM